VSLDLDAKIFTPALENLCSSDAVKILVSKHCDEIKIIRLGGSLDLCLLWSGEGSFQDSWSNATTSSRLVLVVDTIHTTTKITLSSKTSSPLEEIRRKPTLPSLRKIDPNATAGLTPISLQQRQRIRSQLSLALLQRYGTRREDKTRKKIVWHKKGKESERYQKSNKQR
jgi:hypothetical protein